MNAADHERLLPRLAGPLQTADVRRFLEWAQSGTPLAPWETPESVVARMASMLLEADDNYILVGDDFYGEDEILELLVRAQDAERRRRRALERIEKLRTAVLALGGAVDAVDPPLPSDTARGLNRSFP